MSLDATLWAWKQDLKPTLKILLLSLADRAGEDHTCFPSIQRLEFDTGLNRKTVVKNLKVLQENGLISQTGETVGRTKRVKKYVLNGITSREFNEPKNGTIPKTEPFQKRTENEPKNGPSKQAQKRTSESSINLTSQSNLQLNNKKLENFKLELEGYLETYGRDMLNSFHSYWTEKNQKGKMRFELQPTWETSKRLVTWSSNSYGSQNKPNRRQEKEATQFSNQDAYSDKTLEELIIK